MFQEFNRPAFIGCWITFIILTAILNTFAISCIIYLYVKRPTARCGSPKLLVMLCCCLIQIMDAVGPSVVGVHIQRMREAETEFKISCEGLQALELMSFMAMTIEVLLVAAVIMVEALKLQRFVTLTSMTQMVVAVVLVVVCVLYGIVVIIPVFYMAWLADNTKPCGEDGTYLEIEYRDLDKVRAMPISDFIIPECFVFIACVLLLVAYFTRKSTSRRPVYVQYNHPHPQYNNPQYNNPQYNNPQYNNPQYISPPQYNNAPPHTSTVVDCNNKTVESTGNAPDASQQYQHNNPSFHVSNNAVGTQLVPPVMDSQENNPFPISVVLAAIVTFVFGVVFFLQSFRVEVDIGSVEFWAAGILLLSLMGVFLPCCWLLDFDLRTVWCCCGQSSNPSGGTVLFLPGNAQGPQEGGETTRL